MARKAKVAPARRGYALLRDGCQAGSYASLAAALRAIANPDGHAWSAQLVTDIERDGEPVAWRLAQGSWLPQRVAVKTEAGWATAPAL